MPANLADFGAIPDNSSEAAIQSNAQAFRDAFDSGARRILIPAGTWYFEEIMYLGVPTLPVAVEIFGEGREGQTNLIYRPSDSSIPAFAFAPDISRSTLRNLRLAGPSDNVVNRPPRGIGISLEHSLLNHVRDVVIVDFDVGIVFSSGVAPYSGNNCVERFEVNGCRTGVLAGDLSHACVLRDGRIFRSIVLHDDTDPRGAREEGVGLDVPGTMGEIGPLGAHGLTVSGVNIENSPLCVRIATSMGVSLQGCYIEPGNIVQGEMRRRSIHVDEATMGLTIEGTLFSEPEVPFGEWNWTPTYVELPPESRGVVDVPQAPHSGSAYRVNAYGGAINGATAAKANLLKNSNMSRGAMFWNNSPVLPPTVTPHQTPFVTGGAATELAIAVTTTEHVYQDFVVDSGVRSVTVGFRYRLLDPGANAFRVDLVEPSTDTRLGFFSDVGPGQTRWRTRSLTGRFDGFDDPGPQTLRVRVFPFAGAESDIAGQRVLIDSIWVVEGEYAATYRPYSDGLELLVGDDREEFFAGTTNAGVGPVEAMPVQVPSNAIGMKVEMSVEGSDATATRTLLRVDDRSGTSTTRDVYAYGDGRSTLTEYTLPVTPGTPPQWSVFGANAGNTVEYAVRLKAWILRL